MKIVTLTAWPRVNLRQWVDGTSVMLASTSALGWFWRSRWSAGPT
jgi:hypothetical protein